MDYKSSMRTVVCMITTIQVGSLGPSQWGSTEGLTCFADSTGTPQLKSAIMRSARRFLWGYACLICAAGCATSPYPDDWPRPIAATASQCPDLTGSYENFGHWDDGDRIILATLFFPLAHNEPLVKGYELLAVSHVTLEHQGNNDLVVRAWVGAEQLMERQLPASQLPCREGRIVFHDGSWGLDGVAPFLPVVYHSSVDRLLSLASDGSLVIENQEFTKGAIIVIPVAAKAQYWYRFLRVSPDSPGQLNDVNRPRGVHTGTSPDYRLLPPEGAPAWSGYSQAGTCLDQASKSEDTPDAQVLASLGGRSTQAFIVQDGRGGALLQNGNVIGNDWIPATHGLRVEKQHWEPPSIADRYVICLLQNGYRWEYHED